MWVVCVYLNPKYLVENEGVIFLTTNIIIAVIVTTNSQLMIHGMYVCMYVCATG